MAMELIVVWDGIAFLSGSLYIVFCCLQYVYRLWYNTLVSLFHCFVVYPLFSFRIYWRSDGYFLLLFRTLPIARTRLPALLMADFLRKVILLLKHSQLIRWVHQKSIYYVKLISKKTTFSSSSFYAHRCSLRSDTNAL